jgi:hypothetical protein
MLDEPGLSEAVMFTPRWFVGSQIANVVAERP